MDKLEKSTNFPIVIKIPDGSFSRGVIKVQNRQELEVKVAELFKQSALLTCHFEMTNGFASLTSSSCH
ncbi:MAG: hypothetical protein ACXV8Q_20340 [Methylobacter sp.]